LRVLKEISLLDMDKKEKDLALREAKILEILDNQFIISFKDVFKTKAGKLCIVMDYAEKGDLDRNCRDRRKKLEKSGGQD